MVENSNILVGIDTSAAQGNINWQQVADSNKIFYVVQKATQGGHYVDPTFKKNVEGAKTAGIKVIGFYHYAVLTKDTLEDALSDARNFVSAVRSLGPFDPANLLALDIESTGIPAGKPFYTWMINFLDYVEKELGSKPFIYSGYYFLNQNLGKLPEDIYNRIRTHPYWQASYVDHPENFIADVFKGIGFKLLQKSGDIASPHDTVLHVPGINGAVDKDYFYGTIEELQSLILSTKIISSEEVVSVSIESKDTEAISEDAGKEQKSIAETDSSNDAPVPEENDFTSKTAMVGTKNNIWAILNIIWQFIMQLFKKK